MIISHSKSSLCYVNESLYLRFRSNGEKNPRVKHYQIRQTEKGEAKFYLAEKYLFSTIPELIHYHQHNAAGKCGAFPHATVILWITSEAKWKFTWKNSSCFKNVEAKGKRMCCSEMLCKYASIYPCVLCVTGLITRLRHPISQDGGRSRDTVDPSKGWRTYCCVICLT